MKTPGSATRFARKVYARPTTGAESRVDLRDPEVPCDPSDLGALVAGQIGGTEKGTADVTSAGRFHVRACGVHP